MQHPVMVEYLKRPVRVHLLIDVEDGGDDVSPQMVEVGRECGPSGVFSQTVCRGALELELLTDPLLCPLLQEMENIRLCCWL